MISVRKISLFILSGILLSFLISCRFSSEHTVVEENRQLSINGVFNDIMAMALISTFEQAGIRVPGDISIIGYDNIELAPYFSPPLTTVHQPKRRLGKTAVEILMERMKDKNHARRVFEMAPELVIRKSVKDVN